MLVKMVARPLQVVWGKRMIHPPGAGMSRGSQEKASPLMEGLPRDRRMNRGHPAPPGPPTEAGSVRGAVRKARAPRPPVEGPLKAPAP